MDGASPKNHNNSHAVTWRESSRTLFLGMMTHGILPFVGTSRHTGSPVWPQYTSALLCEGRYTCSQWQLTQTTKNCKNYCCISVWYTVL